MATPSSLAVHAAAAIWASLAKMLCAAGIHRWKYDWGPGYRVKWFRTCKRCHARQIISYAYLREQGRVVYVARENDNETS